MTASHRVSRRRLLAGGGAVAAGLLGPTLLSGCQSDEPATGGGDQAPDKLVWWDQFLPLSALEKKTFEQFHQDGGPSIEYTTYNPNDQGKALQLAFNSSQMPDVFTLAGVNTQISVLEQAGWFAPLAEPEKIKAALPDDVLFEGQTTFDGKLYSVPIQSFRQYDTLPWANKDLLAKADIAPDDQPQSWDDFRNKVRTAQQKSGVAGLILPVKFAPRMATFANDLAQGAGFPGAQGIEYATGDYHFHHDTYVQAIEYLQSFQKDKLLLAASSNLDARAGRARWAAGQSVYFMDGPYCAGVCQSDFKAFMDKLSVGQMPTPDGQKPVLSAGPRGGTFWISKQSKQVETASKLLQQMMTPEYRLGQAEAMDAAPIDLDVVAKSKAHDTFKQCCAFYAESGFLGPSAVVSNPAVSRVMAAAKPVTPDLGAIVQGVMSGQIKDIRGALKKYSDALSTSREAAIKSKGEGDVTLADWEFPEWKPGVDFSGK